MDVLKHHVGSYLKEDGIEAASALKRKTWRNDDENDKETADCQQQQVQPPVQQEE